MSLEFALLGLMIFFAIFWIKMDANMPKDPVKVPARINTHISRRDHN